MTVEYISTNFELEFRSIAKLFKMYGNFVISEKTLLVVSVPDGELGGLLDELLLDELLELELLELELLELELLELELLDDGVLEEPLLEEGSPLYSEGARARCRLFRWTLASENPGGNKNFTIGSVDSTWLIQIATKQMKNIKRHIDVFGISELLIEFLT